MKKIINGKKYDTGTAEMLASWSNGLSYRDFSFVSETLYRKRTGEYFLHGDGGPMTEYRVYSGCNSWGGGEKIIPMTESQARKWVESNLGADDYESIFGEVEE